MAPQIAGSQEMPVDGKFRLPTLQEKNVVAAFGGAWPKKMLSDTRDREGIESSHIFRYQGTITYPTKREQEIIDSTVTF